MQVRGKLTEPQGVEIYIFSVVRPERWANSAGEKMRGGNVFREADMTFINS